MSILLPLSPVSQEQKAQLIMELMAYAVTRDRIWDFNTPSVSLAKLIAAIYLNRPLVLYGANYLSQELKKAPELANKLKPYIGEL